MADIVTNRRRQNKYLENRPGPKIEEGEKDYGVYGGLGHLPHIRNIRAGINKHDPQHNSIFEVYFTLPPALQSIFKEEEILLTEQVTKVSGLEALQKTTAAGQQKFMGITVSFLEPTLDTTSANITIEFNLNIRNVTDAWVLKIFKAWEQLSYSLGDGTRGIKEDYISDSLRISCANRNGQVFRTSIFHFLMLTNITGLGDLDYESKEAQKITCTFRSDFWDDDFAEGLDLGQ